MILNVIWILYCAVADRSFIQDECRILEIDQPVEIVSKDFEKFEEYLNDFNLSGSDLDILIFVIQGGKSNRFIRIYADDENLLLSDSKSSFDTVQVLSKRYVADISNLTTEIEHKNYLGACLDYSSSITQMVLSIKIEGESFFSLSVNSDDFLDSPMIKDKQSLLKAAELIKLIYSITNDYK